MSDDFLSRWSRLKRNSTQAPAAEPKVPAGEMPPANKPALPPAASQPAATPQAPAQPLPPVESLNFDSDFAAFMKPEVDGLLKRQALKTLFQDPRFNVMDGLDVYIDDYSKPDPLPEGWLEKMTQTARLGEYQPPVEEVPPPAPETADALPLEAAEGGQNDPQKEMLATPVPAPPSDTLEPPAMPPRVPQSHSGE